MEKLIEIVKKELKQVEEQGLSMENLETTFKLVDILKDLYEVKEGEGGQYGMSYRDGYEYRIEGRRGDDYYHDGRGGGGGNYRDGRGGSYNDGYGRPYMDGGYGAPRRSYNGHERRMKEHMDRIYEGLDMYEYGRDRYQHGGTDERMIDGLEKLMYALCMFVESAMDFAESPQEKEVIRKHIQKIRAL